MRSSNPILSNDIFSAHTRVETEQMTIQGTVNKCFLLLVMVLGAASWTWRLFFESGAQAVTPFIVVGAIGGLVLALMTYFKTQWAHVTAPAYAVCQGLFLGALSSMFEASYPGIVIQAVGLTFGTLFCLLGAYKSGLIKVTENFKLGIAAATGGICMFYFVSFILSMFGFHLNVIYGNGLLGVGFSLIVVTIAALNLVMDFDFIEEGARQSAPKQMEWVGAFALMVTLIWLYIEILRLLAKLRDRR
ncbi:MAG: Bax inhibitor-1/YccA family protein [bacterium]